MDVNSVLQKTRQYFQGIPSGSSSGGELAPGALAGYGGPPVSSAASTAGTATNPYPPYQRQHHQQLQHHHQQQLHHHQQQQSFPHNSWSTAPPPTAQNAIAYHQPPPPSSAATSAPNSAATYSRPFAPSPYQMYESTRRSPKPLPTSSPSTYSTQHNYTAPSITRTNAREMFSMDSIVCQSEANHQQNKKSKSKSSPATVFKPQPTQQEESRFYGRGLAPHPQQPVGHPPQPPPAPPVPAARLPSIVPPHISTPSSHHQQLQQSSSSHQNYPVSGAHFVQQQVGYQQVSYPTNGGSSTVATRQTSIEKVSLREPADVPYYHHIETTTTVETTAPLVAKRDSPLDLSVKTIRQSADSTALDDPENPAYSHFALASGHHQHGRHPHLHHLPYALPHPAARNHSTGAAMPYGGPPNPTHHHYPIANPLPTPAYPELGGGKFVVPNGHLRRDEAALVGRLPVSEKMTVSITYEQKQQTHHTQVNAKVSAVSHYYPLEGGAKGQLAPTLPPLASLSGVDVRAGVISSALVPLAQPQPLPPASSPASLLSTKVSATISAAVSSKKRPCKYDEAPPIPPPKMPCSGSSSQDWRENVSKEIDNRINAYTAMKARVEEEERQHTTTGNDGYRVKAPVAQPPKVVPEVDNRLAQLNYHQPPMAASTSKGGFGQHRPPSHSPKSPFIPYAEAQHHRQPHLQNLQEQQLQQKAQHKLPVQTIQMHHSPQQWYSTNASPAMVQRPPSSNIFAHSGNASRSASPYKPPVYQEVQPLPFSKSGLDGCNDLKIIEKVENPKLREQEQHRHPLPSFQHLPTMSFPQKSKSSASPHQQLPSIDNRYLENRIESKDARKEVNVASADRKFLPAKDKSEPQSRESIKASVLAHPRFRTKAELKQVTLVDESRNKMSENDKLPHHVQSFTPFSSRAFESESLKLPNSKIYNISDSKMDSSDEVHNHRPGSVDSVPESENLCRAVLSSRSPSIADSSRQYSPRKRVFSKSEDSVANVKRSSSETTVFEFRDSDSEPETSGSDLHSLHEMRKDRKTRAPSETPTIIEQLNEEHQTDDSQWLAACDELINQFAGGSIKKRGRKKKPIPIIVEDSSQDEEPPSPPPKQPSADESSITPVKKETTIESPISSPSPVKIKKEKDAESPSTHVDKPSAKMARVKVEKSEAETRISQSPRTKSEERKPREVIDKEGKGEKQSEMRGQRSNVGTTRIRIQNLLEDTSDSDEGSVPIAKRYGLKKPKVTKKPRVFKKALIQKLAQKKKQQQQQRKLATSRKKLKMRHRILKRMETRKSKMEAERRSKVDGDSSGATSDSQSPTEEAPQAVVTRKMARRECQKEGCRREEELAASSPKKSEPKTGSNKVSKEERKPTSKEKLPEKVERDKSTKRREKIDTSDKSDKVEESSGKRGQSKDTDSNEKAATEKVEERSSRRNAPKDDTAKQVAAGAEEKVKKRGVSKDKSSGEREPVNEERIFRRRPFKDKRRGRRCHRFLRKDTNSLKEVTKEQKSQKKEEDCSRRTLRSGNVVVANEKFGRSKLRVKKGLRGAKASTLVLAAKLRLRQRVPKGEPAKRERRTRMAPSKGEEAPKNGAQSKNGDAKPSVQAENKSVAVGKDVAAGAKPTSWEEELFKYKYSLRMPVKLINISRPPNWPKSNGGSSSLPDLDREETDSDLLSDAVKQQKTPKKRNNNNNNATHNNNHQNTATNSKNETKFSNTKEFKDSVRFLQEKFDQKIEEKNQQSTNLAKLMMEKKMKIIPKSSDGPELLPTPSLDGFRAKLATKGSDVSKKDDRCRDSSRNADVEDEALVDDSLIGSFRKETVDEFKEVFEKHTKSHNQLFKTVILESRTRTQTKELKHDATLKRVFGLDRPASAPPIPEAVQDDVAVEAADEEPQQRRRQDTPRKAAKEPAANGVVKSWKGYGKFRLLVAEEAADSDRDCKDFDKDSKDFEKDGKDFEEAIVDFECREEDAKVAIEPELGIVVKKRRRAFRRKCRSSGFDYIRKKKKQQKKEEDDVPAEEKEEKKPAVYARPIESIEDIQNEIKTWVVNKGIGETVLHKAARLGYLDISSYCLEKLNCLPSPTDNAGYTPLHEACTRGHLKIAKILLKYGADVSASARGGIRPLHEAVENGDIEVVRLLLSYGADPMLSTYAGQTPLSLVKDDRDDLKEFLLLYLADIQGNPSKPWPFGGYDQVDNEDIGYNALGDAPPPNFEELDPLEIEISEYMLPNLYKFKEEFDYWVLSSDLPAKIRDMVTKRAQEQNPPPYIVRKINRVDFDENVESAMLLDDKYLSVQKCKSKCPLVTLVKYTEKLMSVLSIEKISMSFS